jgi:hypothetical protein
VKSLIRYVPEDIMIDLGEDDLDPGAAEILFRHYRQAVRRFTRSSPAFTCERHQGGSNPGLFLKRIGGQWWAVHYEASECRPIRLPAPMSDEHKRQAEYWARAAQDAGYQAEFEARLSTRTRPDVLIHGPAETGIEVQRSPMTAAGAVERTRRAAAAGVTDLWFTTAATTPKWAWRVPTVLDRELGIAGEGQPWDTTPQRRSVHAAGLRVIRGARCEPGNFGRCPQGRRHCGRHHPKAEPWGGLSVDDVAGMFPARLIVPLRFRGVRMLGSRHRDAVFLVSPQSASLYTELTGLPAAPTFRPEAEDVPPWQPAGRSGCRNPQPDTGTTPQARCGVCQLPLHPALAQAGETTHPACDPDGLSGRWPASQPVTCALCGTAAAEGVLIRLVPGSAAPGGSPRIGHDRCVTDWASRNLGAHVPPHAPRAAN